MSINGSNDKSLEAWIWDAACSIRGAKEAPKYKDYILPLIFVKRLCDVFDDDAAVIRSDHACPFEGAEHQCDGFPSRAYVARYLLMSELHTHQDPP